MDLDDAWPHAWVITFVHAWVITYAGHPADIIGTKQGCYTCSPLPRAPLMLLLLPWTGDGLWLLLHYSTQGSWCIDTEPSGCCIFASSEVFNLCSGFCTAVDGPCFCYLYVHPSVSRIAVQSSASPARTSYVYEHARTLYLIT